MAPIIRTEGLRKVYAVGKERVVALDNVDISVEKGEFCCIVGAVGQRQVHPAQPAGRAGKAHPRDGLYLARHEHLAP